MNATLIVLVTLVLLTSGLIAIEDGSSDADAEGTPSYYLYHSASSTDWPSDSGGTSYTTFGGMVSSISNGAQGSYLIVVQGSFSTSENWDIPQSLSDSGKRIKIKGSDSDSTVTFTNGSSGSNINFYMRGGDVTIEGLTLISNKGLAINVYDGILTLGNGATIVCDKGSCLNANPAGESYDPKVVVNEGATLSSGVDHAIQIVEGSAEINGGKIFPPQPQL